jgi:hypothetical protein
MRLVFAVSLLMAGCMDSSASIADLPRCAEMTSCRAAISGPGENWLLCGAGAEFEAECAPPLGSTEACRVERQDPCVCRFGADGVVTALCHSVDSQTYP